MSTRQGMRKILKRSLGPYHHIKKKYEAGLFDGEYPFSYEAMQLEPPFPMPVGVMNDVKYEPHKGKIVLPTDPLVKQYIRRNGTKAAKDYYDRPTQQVGIGDYESYIQSSASSSESKHRLMKGTVSEAYYFASRQYEYMQKHWADIDKEDGMTEEEIVANVERLLEDEAKEERFKSRQTAKDIQNERNEKDVAASAASSEPNLESSTAETEESSATTSTVAVASSDEEKKNNILEGLPTMLHGKPKVILQMTMWNERFKQTPYKYWTVGAATALDHWIALEILDLSEQTWQTVLERNTSSAIRGIANDIVTVRNALFPETLEDYDHDDDDEDDDVIMSASGNDDEDVFLGTFSSGDAIPKNSTEEDETEKNIDELLKSLGVPDEDVLDQDEFWNTAKTGGDGGDDGEDKDGDDDDDKASDDSTFDQHAFETNSSKADQLSRLRLELNQWQKKNHDLLFEKWSESEKEEFNTWLHQYIKVITEDVETNTPNTTEISEPDFKATRDAIFNEPYVPYDQDELMWMAMSEDTEAELVLKQLLESRDELLQQGVLTPEEYQQWQHFEQLSYRDQLKQLRSIDAMRTITGGTGNVPGGSSVVDRETMQSFATDHMEFLRQGVQMNELTPDLEGAITSKTISNELPNDEHLFSYKQHTLQGADQSKLEHDSDLHTEWGRFKSNVANHEESLYEQGRMGIDKRTKTNDKKSKKKKKDDFDM